MPRVAQLDEGIEDRLHEDGRQAERGLVEQQQPRPADQRARDRHHLLLAAAQQAGRLLEALGDAREQLEHLVEARA